MLKNRDFQSVPRKRIMYTWVAGRSKTVLKISQINKAIQKCIAKSVKKETTEKYVEIS